MPRPAWRRPTDRGLSKGRPFGYDKVDMQRNRFWILFIVAAVLSACAASPGLEVVGNVDDTRLETQVRNSARLRLALWVGRQPAVGARPDAVADFTTVEETRGSGELNAFRWATGVEAAVGATVYVAAFYERIPDDVPDLDEPLAVAGPFTVSGPTLEDVTVTFAPSESVVFPKVADRLEDLRRAVAEGTLADALALIHPFYLDPWGLTFTEIDDWFAGTFTAPITTATALFANPASAPLAGLWSAWRDTAEFTLTNWEVETLSESERTARVRPTYTYTLAGVGQVTVEERWILTFDTTSDDLLIRRIRVHLQNVASASLSAVQLELNEGLTEGQLIVSWREGERNAQLANYGFSLDRYDPETYTWRTLATLDLPASGSDYKVVVGPGTNADVVVALPEDGFYRVQVAPKLQNGTVLPASRGYVLGNAYPF